MSFKIDLEYLYFMKYRSIHNEEGMSDIIKFCMDLNLITKEYECPKCGKTMKLIKRIDNMDKCEWCCRVYKPPCHTRRCVRKGTWFENSKLALCDILLMTEFFVMNRAQSDVIKELKLSTNTVCDWRCLFRENCMDMLIKDSCPIGGVGEIVEIYECKFGKRNYNRQEIKGEWVIGGLERGSNKCFLQIVEKESVDNLIKIIQDFILPGTKLYSDCWEKYNCYKNKNFKNIKLENSLDFENNENGANANASKGTWSAFKRVLPNRRATDQLDSYLAEYLWRKKYTDCDDLMRVYLEGVATIYKPLTKDEC